MCGPMKCRKNFSDYLFSGCWKMSKNTKPYEIWMFYFWANDLYFSMFLLGKYHLCVSFAEEPGSLQILRCLFKWIFRFWKKKKHEPFKHFQWRRRLIKSIFCIANSSTFSFFGSFYFANTRTGRVISLPHPAKERMT